jgi:hypothetical protein
MTLRELITLLEKARAEHGDIEVVREDCELDEFDLTGPFEVLPEVKGHEFQLGDHTYNHDKRPLRLLLK